MPDQRARVCSCPIQQKCHKTERHKTMEICAESFDGEKYTVDVGVDDTTADIRRKVASAAELREDGFDMSFGGKVMAEDHITQLSAGDTVVLTKKTKSQKDDAIAALRDLGETRLTRERFEGLTDPKLVHLFLQAEVVTEIPDKFLEGDRWVSTFLAEVDFSNVSVVTHVGDDFLLSCTSLHTVDLSGWSNVTHIGGSFLSHCTAMTTLNISGWNNVTHIGNFFLYHCRSLRTVDFTGWGNVTQIAQRFLSHCRSLQTVDLTGWNNVMQIDNGFLSDCSGLTTLDLSGWNTVRRLNPSFLADCRALRTLDLSGWNNVTYIGSSFLSNCTSLTALNVSGWNNVASIEYFFLHNCHSLTTLDMSGWTSVHHIGIGFLEGCTIPASNVNATGSSRVVSKHALRSRDVKTVGCECVCM